MAARLAQALARARSTARCLRSWRLKRYGFHDDYRSWPIPDEAVMQLVARLRMADPNSRDPETGAPIDPASADTLADSLQVAVELAWSEGLLMDRRQRPAVRWALAEWSGHADVPEWVTGLSNTEA